MRTGSNLIQATGMGQMHGRPRRLTGRCAALLLSAVIFYSALPGTVYLAQTATKPIKKDSLLKALSMHALRASELIADVKTRGVSFEVTDEVEVELREAGAGPKLIEAIRSNYRPPPKPAAPAAPAYNYSIPPGPPLSPAEVVALLQSGMGSDRVQKYVETLGVNFSLSPQTINQIKAAGGSGALIGAIAEISVRKASGASKGEEGGGSPDYDDLTDQATVAMHSNNSAYAIDLLQHAIAMDGTRPQAYSLLEFAELYGARNMVLAEKAARAAIERGGSAVFRVRHVHDATFETFCLGSIFVAKSDVTFKADDGGHTFEVAKSELIEASLDANVGKQFAAFYVKLADRYGKSKYYYFMPVTKSGAESNLTVNLITGYKP
jgi:hypothetical protein